MFQLISWPIYKFTTTITFLYTIILRTYHVSDSICLFLSQNSSLSIHPSQVFEILLECCPHTVDHILCLKPFNGSNPSTVKYCCVGTKNWFVLTLFLLELNLFATYRHICLMLGWFQRTIFKTCIPTVLNQCKNKKNLTTKKHINCIFSKRLGDNMSIRNAKLPDSKQPIQIWKILIVSQIRDIGPQRCFC